MSGCEHLCSTYDIQLELECFLFGKRERINTAEPVRFLFGKRERINTAEPVRYLSGNSERFNTAEPVRFASTYDTVPR